MTELEQYINSYFGVEKSDLNAMVSFFRPQVLKKGEFYVRKGAGCDKISFIKSGIIRIFADTENKEVTQWISTKGYFITDLSAFLFQVPARYHMQALTDCEMFTISGKAYQELGEIIPTWHKLEKLFIGKCFSMLEDRIFSHLSMSAEERYSKFFEHHRELFNQVPLQFIASMLGMAPETLSRLRKKT